VTALLMRDDRRTRLLAEWRQNSAGEFTFY